MFPLYDENPTELIPYVTLLFIGACAGAWLFIQGGGLDPGTAFWAHIGGFVAGVALIKPFSKPALVEAKWDHKKLSSEQVRAMGWW